MTQTPRNAMKAALAAGKHMRGVWLNLGSEITAEMAGRAGFGWAVVDGEHGAWDPVGLRRQLIALAGTGTHGVLRVPVAEDWIIKQALDLGCETVMVPMIETAEAAEAVVRACRYAPEGVRGVAPAVTRAGGYGVFGDYLARARDEVGIVVQVESVAALAELEAIAAVEGVDAVFIGPADLGVDMGHADRLDDDVVWDEILAALRRIRATGKASGVLTFSPERARQSVEAGVTMLGVACDAALLQNALSKAARP